MKAIIANHYGSPDVLQLCDIPIPEPLPHEVLVHNHFLSGITGGKNRGSLFYTWASSSDYVTKVEDLRECASAVFDLVIRGQLHLHIAGVLPLEQAAQAHRLLESRATSGKLLLKVS